MTERQEQDQRVETSVYEPLKDSFDSIRLRLDPAITLEKIRHSLLRNIWDAKYEKWVNPEKLPPMLTEQGVQDLMIELESRMSIDKVLGNLKEREYNIIIREIGESVLEFLFFNKELYEVKESDITRIFHIVSHNVRIFLSRAREGLENLYLSRQFQYKDVQTRSGSSSLNTIESSPSGFLSFGGRR